MFTYRKLRRVVLVLMVPMAAAAIAIAPTSALAATHANPAAHSVGLGNANLGMTAAQQSDTPWG